MNILIPVIGFGNQGGYRVLSELSNNWIKNGHEVTFLCYEGSQQPYFPTMARIIWFNESGCEVIINNPMKKVPLFRMFSILRGMRKAIENTEGEYDILLANEFRTARPVARSRRNIRKFYYIQAYEPDYCKKRGIRNYYFFLMSRRSYSYKLIKIVNSPLYFDYHEIKAEKCVYPGLDMRKFYLKKESREPGGKFIVGCIGRTEPYKGTAYVIEAFNILFKDHENIELKIAFGDPSMDGIKGVERVIPQSDTELGEYYRSIDVLVAPSIGQHGAVHYPVIEAMACGTPVVTTGYYPADDNNAWIIPEKDPYSIVNAIEEIINNPELAKQKIALAIKQVEEFDWMIVSSKMLEYFKE